MTIKLILKFLRDRRGSVLPMFAIAAVPMIVATGAVVDYNRAYDQSTVVQDAMDGAALAAGKKLGIWTDTQIKAEAQAFYNANVATKIDIQPTIDPVISAATLTITSELHVPTYFLGMIGLNEFVFKLKSQTTQAMGTLEVVMALDNSGSMAGTKISTLITAAKDLTDTLYNLGATSTKPNPVDGRPRPFRRLGQHRSGQQDRRLDGSDRRRSLQRRKLRRLNRLAAGLQQHAVGQERAQHVRHPERHRQRLGRLRRGAPGALRRAGRSGEHRHSGDDVRADVRARRA